MSIKIVVCPYHIPPPPHLCHTALWKIAVLIRIVLILDTACVATDIAALTFNKLPSIFQVGIGNIGMYWLAYRLHHPPYPPRNRRISNLHAHASCSTPWAVTTSSAAHNALKPYTYFATGLFIIYLFYVIGQRIACCLYGFEQKFIEATRNVIIKAETRKYVDDNHTISGVVLP